MVVCCILENLCDWKFDLDLLKTCLNVFNECLDNRKGLILLPIRFLISIICDIIELILVVTEYGLTFWEPYAFWITVFVLFIIWCVSFLVSLFIYCLYRRGTNEQTIEGEKRWKVFGTLIKASMVNYFFFAKHTPKQTQRLAV